MGEGERGRQAEDPFEDLERFFEPIQRLEWPDDDAPPAPGPGGDQDVTVIPEAETPAAPAPEAAPEVTLDPRPTGELSVEEWRRLRDVLGDEEDEVQFESQPEAGTMVRLVKQLDYEDHAPIVELSQ